MLWEGRDWKLGDTPLLKGVILWEMCVMASVWTISVILPCCCMLEFILINVCCKMQNPIKLCSMVYSWGYFGTVLWAPSCLAFLYIHYYCNALASAGKSFHYIPVSLQKAHVHTSYAVKSKALKCSLQMTQCQRYFSGVCIVNTFYIILVKYG